MISKLKLLIATLSCGFLIFASAPVMAADVFDDACSNPSAQNSKVCKAKETGGENPIVGPNGVFTKVINIVSVLVGIVAIIMIILGGLKLITSGDNPQEVGKARETIVYAIVGVVIALLAQLLVQFVLKKVG